MKQHLVKAFVIVAHLLIATSVFAEMSSSEVEYKLLDKSFQSKAYALIVKAAHKKHFTLVGDVAQGETLKQVVQKYDKSIKEDIIYNRDLEVTVQNDQFTAFKFSCEQHRIFARCEIRSVEAFGLETSVKFYMGIDTVKGQLVPTSIMNNQAQVDRQILN